MIIRFLIALMSVILLSCNPTKEDNELKQTANPIEGTWKLMTGTLIENGDTAVTEYSGNTSFIKIINKTHFAFLQHDLKKQKDSATLSAGGGKYELNDSIYTEHLEYCSAREWEGNDFKFTVAINNDTLVQSGIEKVESAGVNRINIEKYVRLK
jgi:predicted small secreted protein